MTTVTLGQVVAKFVEVITALTPSAFPQNNKGFTESAPPAATAPQRTWAPYAAGAKVVRLFEVETGDRSDLHVMDPQATFCEVPIRVTVAYAGQPSLYGYTLPRSLEATIAADAQLIRNALFLPSGRVGPGHQANVPSGPRGLDRSAPVWFQDIEFAARFYVAQGA
jgi:hypothetical protein